MTAVPLHSLSDRPPGRKPVKAMSPLQSSPCPRWRRSSRLHQPFSASITVNANSPPRPGLFACLPPAGLVLSTDFSFSAKLWGDPDLTLSYQFSSLTSTGLTLVLRLRFLLSYHSPVRPSGLLDHKRFTFRWSRL